MAPKLSAAPQPHRAQGARWHLLRPVFYTVAFLAAGLVSGQIFCGFAFPTALPEPGTPLDDYHVAHVRRRLGELPLVSELREHRGEWLEYDAYLAVSPEEGIHAMTAGLLQGSRAIGVQRVFWNKAEHRLIAVVFLGGAMAGWPGVLHGGGTAAMLLENMERVVGGPELGPAKRLDWRLRDFMVKYRKPATVNQIYVVRAEVDSEPDRSMSNKMLVKVKATLEFASDGGVVTEAHGTCVRRVENAATTVNEEVGLTKGSAWSSIRSLHK